MSATTKAQHTPGPWSAADMGPEPSLWTDGRVWGVYADEQPAGYRLPAQCFPPNSEANARLIAAAPDLYDALCESQIALAIYVGQEAAVRAQFERNAAALTKAREG